MDSAQRGGDGLAEAVEVEVDSVLVLVTGLAGVVEDSALVLGAGSVNDLEALALVSEAGLVRAIGEMDCSEVLDAG